MIVIIKQALSFLCNDNCDSNRVKNDYPKHVQNALFSRPQSENGITTPPLPLNAIVAQRGASWGIYQREKNGQCRGTKVGPQDRQASQTAFRLPLKTGEPVPPFWFAGKRLASNRQPIHLGRAVPADFSAFAMT